MEEEKNDITQDASAFSVPNEIVYFFRNYFIGESTDPELMLRGELLAKTLIRVMLQLHRLGVEDEFQPIFVAMNYIKPHSDEVTKCKRTYETIGGEPYAQFKLRFLTEKYEEVYKEWVKETFGVEVSDEAADVLQQWSNLL